MLKTSLMLSAGLVLGLVAMPSQADTIIGSNGDANEANRVNPGLVTGGAWIRNDQADRSAGPESFFIGGASSGASDFRAYLSFDLSGLSGAATGATLSLFSQGATTFNANGGVNDLGETTLNIVSMSDTITGFGETNGDNTVVTGSGLEGNFDNAAPLYEATVLGTATFNIDTIAIGAQMDITFNAAGLAEIQSAVGGGTLTIGLQAPDAVAAAQNSSARNFFTVGGWIESASTPANDIAPSLSIQGVDVPEPGSLALLGLGGLALLRRRRGA